MIVKNIGPLSVGKILGSLYVILGLFIGGLFSLISLAGAAIGGQNAGPAQAIFGVMAIIIIPVFYGVIGFIGGIIMAALYNLIAPYVGGIEVEFAREDEQAL
jgi:hypothetical protein